MPIFAAASLMVPDITIYVNGSSCNYIFFCLILAPSLSLSIFNDTPQAEWIDRKR